MKTGLLLVLLLALVSMGAHAHALSESTARVTLRDGHLDIVAEFDLFLLIRDDPTSLAVATEAEVDRLLVQVQQELEDQTRLVVDGELAPLVLHGLPTREQLRAVAAVLSASGHQHGELVRVTFDSPRVVAQAGHVTLSLPQAMGPTLVSFVQPLMRYTAPGATASFIAAQPASTVSEVRPSHLPEWLLAALAVGLAALAGRKWMAARWPRWQPCASESALARCRNGFPSRVPPHLHSHPHPRRLRAVFEEHERGIERGGE